MKNWLISTEKSLVEQYRGITIHAHPGLHQDLAELFRQSVDPGACVLDIGAGAGAFSLRLKDLGYQVTALDIDPQKWAASEVPFLVLDINKGVRASVSDQYDAVCCIEVIEHVENPWGLMRDIFSILKPGGIALVSTPNVTNFLSRLVYLRTGNLANFGPSFLYMGHINPIQPYEMREIIKQTGWHLQTTKNLGYLPVMDFGSDTSLTRLPYKLFSNLARALIYSLSAGEDKKGWCSAFILQKPEN